MSERVRQSLASSLLASKRFVVSTCAALAMVLGAMSAGSSVINAPEAVAAHNQQRQENSSNSVLSSAAPVQIMSSERLASVQNLIVHTSVLIKSPAYTYVTYVKPTVSTVASNAGALPVNSAVFQVAIRPVVVGSTTDIPGTAAGGTSSANASTAGATSADNTPSGGASDGSTTAAKASNTNDQSASQTPLDNNDTSNDANPSNAPGGASNSPTDSGNTGSDGSSTPQNTSPPSTTP